MFIRQAVEADHERILSYILHDPICWIDAQIYRRYVVRGSYRADRIWLAEDSRGHILASAVWWSASDGKHPHALDCLYVDTAVRDRVGCGLAAGGACSLPI